MLSHFKVHNNIFFFKYLIGIWADDSDNEGDSSNNYQNKKGPKNYSAPIGFVAGGVQQSGKKNGKDKIKEDTKNDSDEEGKPSTSFKTENTSSESEDDIPRRGI